MTTYYTLTGQEIPQNNIVKTFKKGTCNYQHSVVCPRCFGKGIVHIYGVCFKCNGACKVVVISKGYDLAALKKAQDKIKTEKQEVLSTQAKVQKDNTDRKELEKKALKLQILIKLGGDNSSFASSLASQVWVLVTQNKGKLSDRQMTFVYKFLEKGCMIKNQPHDKVKQFLDSKL